MVKKDKRLTSHQSDNRNATHNHRWNKWNNLWLRNPKIDQIMQNAKKLKQPTTITTQITNRTITIHKWHRTRIYKTSTHRRTTTNPTTNTRRMATKNNKSDTNKKLNHTNRIRWRRKTTIQRWIQLPKTIEHSRNAQSTNRKDAPTNQSNWRCAQNNSNKQRRVNRTNRILRIPRNKK